MTGDFIRQCELRCEVAGSTWVTVSWIPDKLAIVGKPIKLRDDARQWHVTAVYDRREENRPNRHHAIG